MATAETLSRNGSWKVVVDAWSVNWFFYQAMGVTTRVYQRGSTSIWDWLLGRPSGWVPVRADSVSAAGSLASSLFPGSSSPIPGSPNIRSNDSEADCRAWSVGIGITVNIDPIFRPSEPRPSRGPGPIADRVTGTGSASRAGENLAVGPVNWPP